MLPIGLAFLAGVSAVIQQALNAGLRAALGSAGWAGIVSYLVGLTCMAILVAGSRDPLPAASLMARAPWWSWLGGMFGAFFIGLGIVLVPRVGAGTFVALFLAGQVIGSLVLDHLGLFGLAQRSLDMSRLAGAALIVGGVLLVRR